MDYCPFIDTENNLLYFISKRIEAKSKEFNNIKSPLETLNSSQNGMSRVYKTKLIQ